MKNPLRFKKLSHIGIVVKNLEEALEVYSKRLWFEVERTVGIPDVQLKIGILRIGEMEIELLQYQNPNPPSVKSLKADRAGINHICYEVEDFEEAMEKLRANGFK